MNLPKPGSIWEPTPAHHAYGFHTADMRVEILKLIREPEGIWVSYILKRKAGVEPTSLRDAYPLVKRIDKFLELYGPVENKVCTTNETGGRP
jgi:hypothetical protein